jgi:SAM-dependent methyltransferase
MPQFVVEYGKTTAPATADGRLDAPAFHRNHEPIWHALKGFLGERGGDVLEIGSGTGQHIAIYAKWAPRLTWWPSDIFESHLASIAAWRRQVGLDNLRAPQRIDLADPDWSWQADGKIGGLLAAIICINVLHISPWAVSQNLIAGAGRHLDSGGRLFIYGPFKRGGAHTAPSNAAFDVTLKAENPDWGVRDVDDLSALARAAGLALVDTVPMPASNLVLVFGRAAPQD